MPSGHTAHVVSNGSRYPKDLLHRCSDRLKRLAWVIAHAIVANRDGQEGIRVAPSHRAAGTRMKERAGIHTGEAEGIFRVRATAQPKSGRAHPHRDPQHRVWLI